MWLSCLGPEVAEDDYDELGIIDVDSTRAKKGKPKGQRAPHQQRAFLMTLAGSIAKFKIYKSTQQLLQKLKTRNNADKEAKKILMQQKKAAFAEYKAQFEAMSPQEKTVERRRKRLENAMLKAASQVLWLLRWF